MNNTEEQIEDLNSYEHLIEMLSTVGGEVSETVLKTVIEFMENEANELKIELAHQYLGHDRYSVEIREEEV